MSHHFVVHHHRDDGQTVFFDDLKIGASLIEIDQLFKAAVRLDPVERAGDPIGDQPVPLSVGLQSVEIADRHAGSNDGDFLAGQINGEKISDRKSTRLN